MSVNAYMLAFSSWYTYKLSNKPTRCTHILQVGRRDVHHEARLTCLEKDWQSTLEVAQEEVASQKACTSTGQELILVNIWGYSIAW